MISCPIKSFNHFLVKLEFKSLDVNLNLSYETKYLKFIICVVLIYLNVMMALYFHSCFNERNEHQANENK